jgi:hypothetical protein
MTVTFDDSLLRPEIHHDDPVWESGYDAAIGVAVALTHESRKDDETKLRELEAKATLARATGHCVDCGSAEAIEIKPRHPSRTSLWLCEKDLNRVLEMRSRARGPFPGEDPNPTNLRNFDDPIWQAGFRTGLLMMLPAFRWPDDDDARRDKFQKAIWQINRELCCLCPGHLSTWGGGIGGANHRLCFNCLDYLRELKALREWK